MSYAEIVSEISDTTMLSRISGASWIKYDAYIDVFGAGGIGSWSCLYLSRAFPNAKIHIADYDIFEIHNLAGQFANLSSIGELKADAVKNLVSGFSPETNVVSGRIAVNSTLSFFRGVDSMVVAAFDNNEARLNLLNSLLASGSRCYFIDGRLRAAMFEVFCFSLTDTQAVEVYKNTLAADADVDDGPCTFKQTSHVAGMIGAYITAVATTIATNVVSGQKRPVPFYSNFVVAGFMMKKMNYKQYNEWKNGKSTD